MTVHGPTALSLRGLARDLGVTATALVHLYGNLAGLRAAVAESVLEKLRADAGVVPRRPIPVKDVAARWVGFAGAQPNLYRLLSGEGWHLPSPGHRGFHGVLAVASPRRALEDAIRLRGNPDQACYLAAMIHGLALARIDGVGGASVDVALADGARW